MVNRLFSIVRASSGDLGEHIVLFLTKEVCWDWDRYDSRQRIGGRRFWRNGADKATARGRMVESKGTRKIFWRLLEKGDTRDPPLEREITV